MEEQKIILSKSDFYNLMKDFKGYGNPKAKIWLIGQEENWGDDYDFENIKLDQDSYAYYKNKKNYSDKYLVDSFECRLSCNGSTFEKGVKTIVKHFYKDEPFQNSSLEILKRVFIINYNFIPIKLNKSKKVCKIFNKTENEFKEDLANRLNKLMKIAYESNITKIFVLSKEYFNEITKIILEDERNLDWAKGSINYNSIKIYLSYHPSYHGFYNRFNEIKNL